MGQNLLPSKKEGWVKNYEFRTITIFGEPSQWNHPSTTWGVTGCKEMVVANWCRCWPLTQGCWRFQLGLVGLINLLKRIWRIMDDGCRELQKISNFIGGSTGFQSYLTWWFPLIFDDFRIFLGWVETTKHQPRPRPLRWFWLAPELLLRPARSGVWTAGPGIFHFELDKMIDDDPRLASFLSGFPLTPIFLVECEGFCWVGREDLQLMMVFYTFFYHQIYGNFQSKNPLTTNPMKLFRRGAALSLRWCGPPLAEMKMRILRGRKVPGCLGGFSLIPAHRQVPGDIRGWWILVDWMVDWDDSHGWIGQNGWAKIHPVMVMVKCVVEKNVDHRWSPWPWGFPAAAHVAAHLSRCKCWCADQSEGNCSDLLGSGIPLQPDFWLQNCKKADTSPWIHHHHPVSQFTQLQGHFWASSPAPQEQRLATALLATCIHAKNAWVCLKVGNSNQISIAVLMGKSL